MGGRKGESYCLFRFPDHKFGYRGWIRSRHNGPRSAPTLGNFPTSACANETWENFPAQALRQRNFGVSFSQAHANETLGNFHPKPRQRKPQKFPPSSDPPTKPGKFFPPKCGSLHLNLWEIFHPQAIRTPP